MENEQFISGDIDTHFVKKYYSPEALLKGQNAEKALAAEIAIKYYQEQKNKLSVTANESDEWLKRRK